jgi:hypothetical protein
MCQPDKHAMKITKSHPDRFTDEQGSWYGDDGHYWAQRPGCPFSLVEEVSISVGHKQPSSAVVTSQERKSP